MTGTRLAIPEQDNLKLKFPWMQQDHSQPEVCCASANCEGGKGGKARSRGPPLRKACHDVRSQLFAARLLWRATCVSSVAVGSCQTVGKVVLGAVVR